MSSRSTRTSFLLALASAAVLVTACGSSPAGSGGADPAASESASSLAEVYSAVEGLTGDEREQTLIDLADEAGGSVGWYYVGDMTALVDAFQEETGLTVEAYQGTSEGISERARQENQTNQQGSDLLTGAAVDLRTLDEADVIADLDTPVLDWVDDDFKGSNAISPYAILQQPAYNTSLVPAQDQATSWEEVFSSPAGRMGLEVGDWQFYENLVRQYYVDQLGMAEDEAIAQITTGLTGAQQVEGHSLQTELLASGQYGVIPNAFGHSVALVQDNGAPIAFGEGEADLPPFVLTNTMGITERGPNPAGGLLLLEWLMGADAQQIFADGNFATTSSEFEGDDVLDRYDDEVVQTLYLTDTPEDQAEWQDRFDALLQSIGGTPATS